MNEKIKQLISAAGFSTTYESDRLEALVRLTMEECDTAVQNTDTRHAYTTYDKGMIDGTVEKSIAAIYEHFEVPKHLRQIPYR
jgi:hypothetical protein